MEYNSEKQPNQETLNQELVKRFFDGLGDCLTKQGIKFDHPPQHIADTGGKSWWYMHYPIVGRSGFRLAFLVNAIKNEIGVEMVIDKGLSGIYPQLNEQRNSINTELGVEKADWQHKSGNRVIVLREFDLTTDHKSRKEIYDWLLETYKIFYKVFSPKIKSLTH